MQTYLDCAQELQTTLVRNLVLDDVYEHECRFERSLKLMRHHARVRFDVVFQVLLFEFPLRRSKPLHVLRDILKENCS